MMAEPIDGEAILPTSESSSALMNWIDKLSSIRCSKCDHQLDASHDYYPVTGRCGHTICYKCFTVYVLAGVERPCQFMPCPSCFSKFSFPRMSTQAQTLSVMEAVHKLNMIKRGVMRNVESFFKDLQAIHQQEKLHLQQTFEAEIAKRDELLEEWELQKASQEAKDFLQKKKRKICTNTVSRIRDEQYDW